MPSHRSKEVPGRETRPTMTTYDVRSNHTRTGLAADLTSTTYVPVSVDHRGYKNEKNGVPLTLVAGSTTPLVEKPGFEEEMEYNPFESRVLEHPTTDLDTFIHLLKGSLGSGILAMPLAFLHAGLVFGFVATCIVGVICTYCVHILVKCAHKLCHRLRVPALGFSDIAVSAFETGPVMFRGWAKWAGWTINLFLVIDLLGCCCVYIVFVAKNLKQVIDYYSVDDWEIRPYMAMLLVPLLLLSLVRNLKYLAPFSMVANVLIAVSLGITFYYVFVDLPSPSLRPNVAPSWKTFPLFFGTAIFALEGIGVVMPLENNMKTPTHFIGCPGVLNFGMSIVVVLYACVGFLGYVKYGDETKASITLNLPEDQPLAQSVKVMISVAIFLTYGLQFYVPMEIIWKGISHRFPRHPVIGEYCTRVVLVTMTVLVAIAIPNLGPFISLVGALCLSTLGLMFPAIIEIVVEWETKGENKSFKWILIKNIFIILFGLLGFVTGIWSSVQEIVEEFGHEQ